MKHILVTGSDGQLGTVIRGISDSLKQYAFTFLDVHDLDLTQQQQAMDYFTGKHFDYIINCAAYTAVDQAEKEREKAFSVNASVPAMLDMVCKRMSSLLIHLSTDYVYGSNCLPHLEDDVPGPVSVYAHSKLEGEKPLWNNNNALILRTSWLYSEFGNNFLKTMIRLSEEKTEVNVIYDQIGTPTYAGDLAAAIFHIISFSEKNGFRPGIYNYSNEGVCSWFDFATEIMQLTGSHCKVIPIRTEQYPLPARRPAYGVLDKTKIKRNFDMAIPYWKDSLKTAIQNLDRKKAL